MSYSRRFATLAAAVLVASCGERQLVQPDAETPVSPGANAPAPVSLQRLDCTARVDARTVTCGSPSTGNALGDVIIGGQGIYVTMTSSNVAYNSTTEVFSFDATVTNLIPQALGTNDGATADTSGIKVFFDQGPTVTGGTGVASVANADGAQTWTGTNQPYFKYFGAALGADGILVQNEVSATKNWQLNIPNTATTFSFHVYVAANVHYPNGYVDISATPPYMNQTSAQTPTATVRTNVGNPVAGSSVTWSSDAPAVAAVDLNTGQVTAVAPGFANITATSNVSTTGTYAVQVCPNLAVGEVYTATGAAAANICLGGQAGVTEYTAVPLHTKPATTQYTVVGTGIQAVTGPPTPDRIPTASVQLSDASSTADEQHLGAIGSDDASLGQGAVQYASADMSALVHDVATDAHVGGPHVADDETPLDAANGVTAESGGRERLMWYPSEGVAGHVDVPAEPVEASAGMALRQPPGVPVVGDSVNYNAAFTCSGTPSVRRGVVRSVKNRAVIVSDTANPAGGFTTAQYDSIALEFDSIAYPVDSLNFGAPRDNDGNGHVVLFFTRAVNELAPPATPATTFGTFVQKDVFTAGECSNGNNAEILYMLVPDPTGAVNSNVRPVSQVRGSVIITAGHELAHMINAGSRYSTGRPFEASWLDEGMAHAAEELMFYRTSVGLTPKSNIVVGNINTGPNASRRVAAYNTYANQNFGRLRGWLQRPDTAGMINNNSASLARRGVTWAFLRYATDRVNSGDPTFFRNLVQSADTGVVNLSAVIGAPVNDWYRDFVKAMYADDAVSGVNAIYTNQSWNFRSMYTALNGSYQLVPRPLTNATALTLSYGRGGTTAYARFGVAASTFATMRWLEGGSGGTAPTPEFSVRVMRTK